MELPAVNRRVKEIIDHFVGGNVSQFAKMLKDISQPQLNRIFNIDNRSGKYPDVSQKIIGSICKEFPINATWLTTGRGEMLIEEEEKDNNYHQNKKDKKGLPVYESYPATLSNIESYRDEKQDEPDFYINIPQYRHCDFVTRAKGDSMHPIIRNMALVGGRRIYNFNVVIFGDVYIVHTKNGIETIKYIHPHETDPDQILLVPYNGNAKTTPIHKSEILRIYQAEFVLNPI